MSISTYVKHAAAPEGESSREGDQARDTLRDGIASSRALLWQSRVLIELSGCDGASLTEVKDWGRY